MQIKAQSTCAIFGGSFNPIHEGHLGIIRYLSEDPEIDRVLVVPARRSPFKGKRTLLPDALRWNMLSRTLAPLEGVQLCDLEFRREPPSYTFETLQSLASLLPRCGLRLVLGWDALLEFARWHQAGEILRLAGLLAFGRAGMEGGGGNPKEDWRALAEKLPSPWREEAGPAGPESLVSAQGRPLLRRCPASLPDWSGRRILRSRSLEGVPEPAREALAAYWRQCDPG